jgi:hypothetical protein
LRYSNEIELAVETQKSIGWIIFTKGICSGKLGVPTRTISLGKQKRQHLATEHMERQSKRMVDQASFLDMGKKQQ